MKETLCNGKLNQKDGEIRCATLKEIATGIKGNIDPNKAPGFT